MRTLIRILPWVAVSCLLSGSAWAQTDIRPNEWSRGTTLDGFAGVGVDSSTSGPVLGGAVGWEVTPRLAIEGSGSWFEFGDARAAFAGAMKVRARLSGRRTIDPFVQGGVGLYRTTFAPGATEVPAFYRRRMVGNNTVHNVGTTFTDPTLVAGGGVNIFVNRHLSLRPDVTAAIVLRHRRSHVLTTVAVHAVYHFEDHPVTPRRAR